MTDFHEINFEEFSPTAEAVAAGLALEINGEFCFTDAGLFAISGCLSTADWIPEEARHHNVFAVARVLTAARAGGLDELQEHCLHLLFAEQINPVDDSDKGKLLAVLCWHVAHAIGPGRMGHLIEGKKAH